MEAIFADPALGKYTHDAKISYQLLHRCGIKLSGVTFDSLVASYLLNTASIHSLYQIAAAQIQVKVPSREDFLGKGRKHWRLANLQNPKLLPLPLPGPGFYSG